MHIYIYIYIYMIYVPAWTKRPPGKGTVYGPFIVQRNPRFWPRRWVFCELHPDHVTEPCNPGSAVGDTRGEYGHLTWRRLLQMSKGVLTIDLDPLPNQQIQQHEWEISWIWPAPQRSQHFQMHAMLNMVVVHTPVVARHVFRNSGAQIQEPFDYREIKSHITSNLFGK